MNLNNRHQEELQEKLFGLKRGEEEKKTEILAEKFGLPYLNLNILPVDTDVLSVLPEKTARKGEIVVLKKLGRTLRLGVKDPANRETKKIIEDLEKQGYELKIFAVSQSGLNRIWEKYKLIAPAAASIRGVFVLLESELKEFEKSLETIQELKEAIVDLPTTKLLSAIVAGALKTNASDIHLEPTKDALRLRYRVDGILHDIATLSLKQYSFLLSRIKTLSELILNVSDVSQDGRLLSKLAARTKERLMSGFRSCPAIMARVL